MRQCSIGAIRRRIYSISTSPAVKLQFARPVSPSTLRTTSAVATGERIITTSNSPRQSLPVRGGIFIPGRFCKTPMHYEILRQVAVQPVFRDREIRIRNCSSLNGSIHRKDAKTAKPLIGFRQDRLCKLYGEKALNK
jgi:hypothetical protein